MTQIDARVKLRTAIELRFPRADGRSAAMGSMAASRFRQPTWSRQLSSWHPLTSRAGDWNWRRAGWGVD
jgi:hypothetical protein